MWNIIRSWAPRKSREDDLCSPCHQQLVAKHRCHPCKLSARQACSSAAFTLSPHLSWTSSHLRDAMQRRSSSCFIRKLSPLLCRGDLFAVAVSVCSLKHQLIWTLDLNHLNRVWCFAVSTQAVILKIKSPKQSYCVAVSACFCRGWGHSGITVYYVQDYLFPCTNTDVLQRLDSLLLLHHLLAGLPPLPLPQPLWGWFHGRFLLVFPNLGCAPFLLNRQLSPACPLSPLLHQAICTRACFSNGEQWWVQSALSHRK